MRRLLLAALIALPFTAVAQTANWQAKAKLSGGKCQDGMIAFVNETPAKVHITFVYDGRPTGQTLDVELLKTGEGWVENPNGVYGPTNFHVSPGTGKRSMQSTTTDGKCSWDWQ
jgi:hypothetical protein